MDKKKEVKDDEGNVIGYIENGVLILLDPDLKKIKVEIEEEPKHMVQ